ncbi:hypothetical protein [Spirosoma sp.]|uniref:hypothetical protein n=1 Tax=Spirosoma sp. TaxID=1899569 RepID=UPI003B3A18BF
MIKILAIIFAAIVIGEELFAEYGRDITFINGELVRINRFIGITAHVGLPYCIFLLLVKNKLLAHVIPIVLFVPFGLLFVWLELVLIDTTTHPVDIVMLNSDKEGRKLIIRQSLRLKTDSIERDTVWVKDTFIFRKVYSS